MSLSPHDLQLQPAHTALAVVDIQERLLAAMPEETQERVVKNSRILIEGMGALEIPTLVTEQYPKGLGPTVQPLREVLGSDNAPLEKIEFDCACAEGFVERLHRHGARNVVLCGMEAHICVLQTALGLLRQRFNVWVAQDAIASRAKENHAAAERLLAQAGAVVAPTEAILFLLLGKAGSPAFKTISKLIR